MSSRFNSQSSQRDARSALFSSYDQRAGSPSSQKLSTAAPHSRPSSGYGFQPSSSPYSSSNGTSQAPHDPFAPAYGGAQASLHANGNAGFRPATPNKKGQYSDAVLSELENQNEEQVEGMLGKVKMLKDLTIAIGDEIRDSSALAEKMNDGFEGTRVRLRGTMNRMLRMAERTGVGWRVWLGFFVFLFLLFAYVWLF